MISALTAGRSLARSSLSFVEKAKRWATSIERLIKGWIERSGISEYSRSATPQGLSDIELLTILIAFVVLLMMTTASQKPQLTGYHQRYAVWTDHVVERENGVASFQDM